MDALVGWFDVQQGYVCMDVIVAEHIGAVVWFFDKVGCGACVCYECCVCVEGGGYISNAGGT